MASGAVQTSTVRSSERFNATDADIIIKSSDNVHFNIHRKYLEANTGAFPPSEVKSDGDVVELTETSDTLELLFQFIYPQRHPSLSDSPYEIIAPLAEAAEKYEVFSAMNICQIRMLNFLPGYAEGIMAYAAKHGYPEIVDKTSPLVVALPIGDVIRILPQRLVVPWMIYRQQWHDILLFAITSQPAINNSHICQHCNNGLYCNNCGNSVSGHNGRLNLELNISSLFSLDAVVKGAKANLPAGVDINSWQGNIQAKIDAIQKFSTFT